MLKPLQPIIHKDAYTAQVEDLVQGWFFDVIFEPLFTILHDAGVQWDWKKYQAIKYDQLGRVNAAQTALERAITSGTVLYEGDTFRGEFSAAISRELKAIGARFIRTTEGPAFRIAESQLPMNIRATIGDAKIAAAGLQEKITGVLGQMEANIAASPTLGIGYAKALAKILGDLQHQFVRTATGPLDIEIPMEMTPALRKAVTEKFTQNMDLYIKGFSREMIVDLRRRVEENAAAGYRSTRLAHIIEAQYGVSRRKAMFLAEQETSLLVAKYREEEYTGIGCNVYRWSTSHDERVRHSHRILDGRVFAWSDPPLIQGTNRYCNPGEDFRCRCVAVPLVNMSVSTAAA